MGGCLHSGFLGQAGLYYFGRGGIQISFRLFSVGLMRIRRKPVRRKED